jgi:outer membrane protein
MKTPNSELSYLSLSQFVTILPLICGLWTTQVHGMSTDAITIQDAVQRSMLQNPALKNLREKVTEANGNLGLAIAQIFPSLSATGVMDYEKDPANVQSALFGGNAYNNYNVGLKLSQPLFDGGAILGGFGAAKKQILINGFALQQSERDTTLTVITDFYGTLYNRRLLDTLRRTEAAITESVKTTDRFYKNGRSQLTDLLQIKTTLALLQPQITAAQAAILTTASHLNYDLGTENQRDLVLTSNFITPPPEMIHARVAQARLRPEIESIHTQLDQFADTRTVQMAVNYPNLSAFGTFGRAAYTKSDLFNDYSNQWTLGLQLAIPLFTGLSSYRQREVLASQEAELHFQQDDLNNQMNYNEVNTEQLFESAISVLKSSEEAFKLADAALIESQKNYRLQTINMLTLVTIEQNYLAASSSFDNAKYQYILAAGNLFVARGIPMSDLVAMLR